MIARLIASARVRQAVLTWGAPFLPGLPIIALANGPFPTMVLYLCFAMAALCQALLIVRAFWIAGRAATPVPGTEGISEQR